MLTRMLTHVLESPVPTNRAVYSSRLQLPFDHMPDHTVISIDDVDHPGGTEPAGIERLPACGRIERGPSPQGFAGVSPRFDPQDRRVEFGEVGVGVVETLGHDRGP